MTQFGGKFEFFKKKRVPNNPFLTKGKIVDFSPNNRFGKRGIVSSRFNTSFCVFNTSTEISAQINPYEALYIK